MSVSSKRKVLALCGGVGGAKLALGLSHVLGDDELNIVVNTGDDFTHLGLRICPDIDTVTYTLAGCVNTATGWGRAGESGAFMASLSALGGEDWFYLGDKDLAMHVERTQRLAAGEGLGAVTQALSRKLGVSVPIIPMTDDKLETQVEVESEGESITLPFQDYFVRQRCEPRLKAIHFVGREAARPHPQFLASLQDPDLDLIVICPSNPFLSIDPILALPGIRRILQQTAVPVVAISPIIGGAAVKGPTAKIMAELGLKMNSITVADYYQDIVSGFILDRRDAREADAIRQIIPRVGVAQTLMQSLEDKIDLARETLEFVGLDV
ncbi:MAG: 2-phospho-L-lactate transferase [Porticoccaceae bacterium]|nr:2-phospho-L-lactate transferase [Porticoccaceae bacterium]